MSDKFNLLVAERVMEWRKVVHEDWPPAYKVKGGHHRTEWYRPDMTEGPGRAGAGLHCSEIPDYQGDIAAAWLLIDKIITDDNGIDQVEIGSDWQQDAPDAWYCLFVHGEFGEWPYATAKTAPFAISLATLRAAGVPETEIQEALDDQKT